MMIEIQNIKPSKILVLIFFALLLVLFPQSARADNPPPVNVAVEGKPLVMPVPPVIVGDHTLIGVRSVSEAVGAAVEWDPVRRQVTITLQDTTIFLTLGKTEALVNGKVVVLPVPAQLVSDRTMVPLRFIAEALGAIVEWNGQTRTVNILRKSVSVTGIQAVQDGRITRVNVATSGKLDYTSFTLQNPNRIVVDFKDAHLGDGVPASLTVGKGVVTRIRSAVFSHNPDKVRVVLDVPNLLPYEVVPTAQGVAIQFVPQIQAVKTEKLTDRTRVTFQGDMPMDAQVTAPDGQKQIRIEIPQGRSGVPDPVIKIADGTINTISFGPGSTPSATAITITLPYYLGHTVVSKDGDTTVVVDIVTSPVYGKRIWIDAGHGQVPGGANDPGTLGKTYGTHEDAMNLAVALELQKRLQAAGAIVYMTRTGSTGADFRDRPALVNAVKPPIDLFVSIHHNSSSASTTRGTETYYWTTNPKSKVAAQQIHAGVVTVLGFPDRGVRMEDFWVIKATLAPSVLVELGYLSNPAEEKAIGEPGTAVKTYPGKAAEAIKTGILNYFLAGYSSISR